MRLKKYINEAFQPHKIKILQVIAKGDVKPKKISKKEPWNMTEREWKETVEEFYRLKKLYNATFDASMKWRLEDAGVTDKQMVEIRKVFGELRERLISAFNIKSSKYRKDHAVKFTDSQQKIEQKLAGWYDVHKEIVAWAKKEGKK